MFSANPALGDGTALDRYVAAPDSSYRYTPTATIPGDGYTAHLLEMASQHWCKETEVDRPLWKLHTIETQCDRSIIRLWIDLNWEPAIQNRQVTQRGQA
jgi:PhoPQ-activated pathogenicity-related protein